MCGLLLLVGFLVVRDAVEPEHQHLNHMQSTAGMPDCVICRERFSGSFLTTNLPFCQDFILEREWTLAVMDPTSTHRFRQCRRTSRMHVLVLLVHDRVKCRIFL